MNDALFLSWRDRWLAKRGLAAQRGESRVDHLRRLAAYREQIRTGAIPKPGPLEWATKIVAEHAAGRKFPAASLRLAQEALALDSLPARGSSRLDGRKASGEPANPRNAQPREVAEVEF
jgi:hypothetical protein